MIKFVARPRLGMTIIEALRATSKNGKAIVLPATPAGENLKILRREGLATHQRRRGKHLYAWCEPIKNGVRR